MKSGLLKAPATVAEEKKMATLVPVSERLYQLRWHKTVYSEQTTPEGTNLEM